MNGSFYFLNIDEVIYRIYLLLSWLWGWIWYIFSFKWIFGSSVATSVGEASRFGEQTGGVGDFISSGLFRLFYSDPRNQKDTINEYINPTSEKGILEYLWGVVAGTPDQQSIFSLWWSTLIIFFVLGAILFAVLNWWAKRKGSFLEKKEEILYDIVYSDSVKEEANEKSTRWQSIVQRLETENQSDWKIALIEADVLLGDVLAEQGFVGETIGEQLKDARARGGFNSLDHAWDAHLLRNRISHDASYGLTLPAAKLAVANLERFFGEVYHMN